ncbi:hypothetical protein H311_03095, partial [Anncaliia algerae PRA109]
MKLIILLFKYIICSVDVLNFQMQNIETIDHCMNEIYLVNQRYNIFLCLKEMLLTYKTQISMYNTTRNEQILIKVNFFKKLIGMNNINYEIFSHYNNELEFPEQIFVCNQENNNFLSKINVKFKIIFNKDDLDILECIMEKEICLNKFSRILFAKINILHKKLKEKFGYQIAHNTFEEIKMLYDKIIMYISDIYFEIDKYVTFIKKQIQYYQNLLNNIQSITCCECYKLFKSEYNYIIKQQSNLLWDNFENFK